jgi:hypothetical protein
MVGWEGKFNAKARRCRDAERMNGMDCMGSMDLSLAFDAEPGAVRGEAKWALMDDADFDEAADAAFPVGNGAGEVFDEGTISAGDGQRRI